MPSSDAMRVTMLLSRRAINTRIATTCLAMAAVKPLLAAVLLALLAAVLLALLAAVSPSCHGLSDATKAMRCKQCNVSNATQALQT
jgi:hypothetical protein